MLRYLIVLSCVKEQGKNEFEKFQVSVVWHWDWLTLSHAGVGKD